MIAVEQSADPAVDDGHESMAVTMTTTLRLPIAALVALVAGLMLTASVPPFGFWPLALVGYGIVFLLLDERRARDRALLAFVAGAGLYGVSLAWMGEFTGAWVVVPTIEAASFALTGVLTPRAPAGRRLAAFAAAVVAGECVRGWWPFGGLPLSGVAQGQASGPFAETARLAGQLLLPGLAAAAGAALAVLLVRAGGRRDHRTRPIPAAVALAVVAAVTVAGHAAPRGGRTSTIDVAIVQGGGPRGFLAVETDPQDVLRRHLATTEEVQGPIDLLLWPEDVVDLTGTLDGTPEVRSALADIARRTNSTFVAGIVEDVSDDRFRNASVAFAPDGRLVDRYDKNRRVPFGEYVPLRSLVDRFGDLTPIPRDAIAGDEPGLLRTPAADLGVAISYEVFFPDRARVSVLQGAELMLVPTNAASFSTTQVPTQQLASARLRAIESGRWLLQAGPTGYAAAIDEEGRLHARSTLGASQVLDVRPELRAGRTPYGVAGDLPLGTTVVVLLLLGWRPWRNRRGRTTAEPGRSR